MIEQRLKECVRIPHGYRLQRVLDENPDAETEFESACLKENFQLIDDANHIIAKYHAWQVDDDFFGYFQYDSNDELIDRKTLLL